MLNLLRHNAGPIGIDLGTSSVKMIQLSTTGANAELLAAAIADVPPQLHANQKQLHRWYISTIKRLLTQHPFKGRKAVTCIPSHDLFIQQLRLPRTSGQRLVDAVVAQAKEKLPFDTEHALLRHVVAGEICNDSETTLEVILMAAPNNALQRHFNLIERTDLDIQSVNVEPCALLNAFSHLLEHANDTQHATGFVDLGHTQTKIVIAHSAQLAFVRTIDIGGKLICQNNHTKKSIEQTPPTQATHETILDSLGQQIQSCFRYHDRAFGDQPVSNVVFVGGLTGNDVICRQLARMIGLPAQLGHPLSRVLQATQDQSDANSSLSKNLAAWNIALGLSLEHSQAQSKGNQTPLQQGNLVGAVAKKTERSQKPAFSG